MKTLLTTSALAAVLAITSQAEAAMNKSISFESNGQSLVGELYLPDHYQEGEKLPAVVVTGAWTTVKEQMPTTYATRLADKGYAALVFDFRGWGGSEGAIKYLEDPARKTADIQAAVSYLATRPEVDAANIAGLGICASAGYMSDAAASNRHIKSLALVAPWLHDAEIVESVYGGNEGVSALLEAARQADASNEPVYLEAASTTNEQALMYQAPYYTETDRGLIPEYDNKFNVASWQGWLTYDALQTADSFEKPALLVHSQAAAIPQGAISYKQRASENVELVMLDDVTQFDFYDKPEAVGAAVDAVDLHFKKTLQ